jgi:spermidine/putrescine transport system substrate-binding protein
MLDPITRRALLRRSAAAGLGLTAASWLAACGGVEGTSDEQAGGETATQAPQASHPKTEFAAVAFANWPLYIDKAVIRDWERETGAELRYTEEINDNEEFYAKVRQELEAGRPIGRDLVALTDWMCARWIEAGFVEPIDKANVPNASNLIEPLRSPPFDAERAYTLPWQSGMTAIGYDPKRTGGRLSSINDLFDPRLKGRVSMLTEWRDTVGLVALGMGVKPAEASKDQLLEAIDKIDEANRNGQIRRFTGNDYTNDLARGNLWACIAWSGDVIQLQADNPDLEFLIPDEGAMLWSDNMMIPKGAEQPYGAEVWMDYVYQPEVAAKIAAEVNYICPVEGAQEVLAQDDPELAENELIFPTAETQAKLNAQPSISGADEREVAARFVEVTGG